MNNWNRNIKCLQVKSSFAVLQYKIMLNLNNHMIEISKGISLGNSMKRS